MPTDTMTKRIITTLIATLLLTMLHAQRENDFATNFVKQGDAAGLQLQTVSPQMMQRMLNLQTVRNNERIADVFSQIKTVRVVSATQKADSLYDSAIETAQRNNRRYTLRTQPEAEAAEPVAIYTRNKKDCTVEVVFIGRKAGRFILLDFTGQMNNDFFHDLTEMLDHSKTEANPKENDN